MEALAAATATTPAHDQDIMESYAQAPPELYSQVPPDSLLFPSPSPPPSPPRSSPPSPSSTSTTAVLVASSIKPLKRAGEVLDSHGQPALKRLRSLPDGHMPFYDVHVTGCSMNYTLRIICMGDHWCCTPLDHTHLNEVTGPALLFPCWVHTNDLSELRRLDHECAKANRVETIRDSSNMRFHGYNQRERLSIVLALAKLGGSVHRLADLKRIDLDAHAAEIISYFAEGEQ